MNRLAVLAILLLAFLGISDSTYLIRDTTSQLFLAGLGVVFFTTMFTLAAVELRYGSVMVRRIMQTFAALGLIVSAYVLFIQFSLTNVSCVYCVLLAALSCVIFVLAYFIEPLSPQGAAFGPAEARPRRPWLSMPPPIS